MIIGICGVCASGKSQLSREIAQRYGFKYIEVDKYNIKLLKQFSKYLEKLYGFDASKDLDKHALNCLKNFKKLNKYEKFLYYVFQRLNTLYRLPYKINKNINNEDNLIIDYVALDKFPFFEKCDIKILMKTSPEYCKENIKKRNLLTDENIDILEKSGIINVSRKYDENKFDFVFDICSVNYNDDKTALFDYIDTNLKNKEVKVEQKDDFELFH